MRIYAAVMIILFLNLIPVAIRLDNRARIRKRWANIRDELLRLGMAYNNVGMAAKKTAISMREFNRVFEQK